VKSRSLGTSVSGSTRSSRRVAGGAVAVERTESVPHCNAWLEATAEEGLARQKMVVTVKPTADHGRLSIEYPRARSIFHGKCAVVSRGNRIHDLLSRT